MTYRVECEIYDTASLTEKEVTGGIFESPQIAADFARAWVSARPVDKGKLPRARMYRHKGKPGVMLSVWRKPDGSIEEWRRA